MARTLFWISLIFVCYTYLAYPLAVVFVASLTRKKRGSDTPRGTLPSVTMIVVVFNEEELIRAKLDNCRSLDYPHELFTVCFVSDGSTDSTDDILGGRDDIIFMREEENRGKPSALNRAVAAAASEIVVFSDVRQIYREDAIMKLVGNFDDPAVGAVSGELVFDEPREHTGRSIGLYWTYEKMIRRAESDIDSTLGATGAIYAVRRELIRPIPEDTILDDIEIPLQAFRKGYRVTFEPNAVAYDTAASEIEREFGRKTRTLAGNFQLFARNTWLLCPFSNRIFIQAISHKLFRLFVPYALLVLLATSFLLDGTAYRLFFVLQTFFYLIGCAAIVSGGVRKNRAANVASVFVSLNAASIVALYRFLTRRSDVRWKR